MRHQVAIRPLAEAEILEASAWYDEQRPGLGDDFADALRTLIWQIAEAPHSYPRVRGEMRRALLRTYRYHVYFRANDVEVVIVAVIHAHRDPGIWQTRG